MANYIIVAGGVFSGIGKGETALSAFDAALKQAGVYNYNLICLSSIIPPGAIVKEVEYYNAYIRQLELTEEATINKMLSIFNTDDECKK